MANEIITAANAAYADGPASSPKQPPKQEIRELFQVVQDYSDSAIERLRDFSSGASHIIARMAAGEAVNIACFGDSTTDGNETTGWTANPTDGGSAIGDTNHNDNAPNSWPVKLQAILRLMYGNNNINVWNAGYSGKRIADGWAVSNYTAAVLENPFYGAPDLTIVGFGLNDQPTNTIAQFENQAGKLIDLIAANGATAVFLTCDPASNFLNGRDNRQVSRRIDMAKRAVRRLRNVEVFEIGAALTDWLETNNDGYRWMIEQYDYLHGGDNWHAFKAGFVASQLFPDTVKVPRGQAANIAPFSPASGSGHGDAEYDPNRGIFNRFGGNWFYTGLTVAAGTKAIDAWVWNENRDALAFYRGVDGETETAFAGGMTTGAKLKVLSTIPGSTTSIVPGSMGFARKAAGYRHQDLPTPIDRLPYGLSRITYEIGSGLVGADSDGYVGWIEVCPRRRASDALLDIGRVGMQVASGAGVVVSLNPEHARGANLWGVGGETTTTLRILAALPVGTGIVFAHNPAYGDAANVAGDASFSILYRSGTTTLGLYNGKTLNGAVSFSSALASGTIADQAEYELRPTVARSGDNQVTTVYSGFGSTTPVFALTKAHTATDWPLFGVVAGGLYANKAVVTGNGFTEIKSMVIE